MTSEYEFIPEDILREIASYSLTPRMTRVSSPIKRIEESLLPERIAYLDRVYPGWNQKIDPFTYMKRGNAFEKMVQNHDLDAIQLVLRLSSNPSAVISIIIYQAVKHEGYDVLQFFINKQKTQREKQNLYLKISSEAVEQKKYDVIRFIAREDYPLERIIYAYIDSPSDFRVLYALIEDEDTKERLLDLVINEAAYEQQFLSQREQLRKYGDYTERELQNAYKRFLQKASK